MRVRITVEVDDEDRQAIAHRYGNHKSGLRGVHRVATRDEVRAHLEATATSDLADLLDDLTRCEVPADV